MKDEDVASTWVDYIKSKILEFKEDECKTIMYFLHWCELEEKTGFSTITHSHLIPSVIQKVGDDDAYALTWSDDYNLSEHPFFIFASKKGSEHLFLG